MEYKAVFLYMTLSWILYWRTVMSNPLHVRGDGVVYRINRDVKTCDISKGHFPVLEDGDCPLNTLFVVHVGCCVQCTVSCSFGQRKANDGCLTECVDCGQGTYNDQEHNKEPKCKECDNSCEGLNRDYSQQCTIRENAKCGGCLEGHFAGPSHANETLAPCHKCVEESDNPTCTSFYNEKKLGQLTTILAISLVGGIILVVIVIVVAVCTVRKVKARRQESKRRNSNRDNNTELKNLMDKNKDANTSLDITDSKGVKPGDQKDKVTTSGVQTGESLRYTGNGGDEKKGVTFGPDPGRKKGILKKPRDPGDGSDSPAESPEELAPTPDSPTEEYQAQGLQDKPTFYSIDSQGEEEHVARGISDLSSEPYQSMPAWLQPQKDDSSENGAGPEPEREGSQSPEYQTTPYPSIGSTRSKNSTSDNWESLPRQWSMGDKS